MMNDFWVKVFIAIFCPLAFTSLVAIGKALLTLYDTLRDHEKKLQDDSDDIKKICEQLKTLKETYNKDRVERNSLMTMATSIDTKIDAKLKDVLAEIAEQRRQDTAMFSQAVSDLNATLGKVNVTLEYMSKDIDGIKRGGK